LDANAERFPLTPRQINVDPFHSYLALAALAMNEATLSEATEEREEDPPLGLQPLDPVWNVTRATRKYIEDALAML
jgi:hypothetical protein